MVDGIHILLSILEVTEHKSEKEFKKYINITWEQTAISLAGHPYLSELKVVK